MLAFDIAKEVTRTLCAHALARLASWIDPDAAVDAVRAVRLQDLIAEEASSFPLVEGYDGPLVTPEAEALRAPRVPTFEPPPREPLAGSVEARGQMVGGRWVARKGG